MAQVRGVADRVYDTSRWNVHDTRSQVFQDFASTSAETQLPMVSLVSFGFKHGIPGGSDLVFDVRFLANPYFVPELKEVDGETQEIKAFVLEHPETRTFLKKYLEFLDYLIPLYEKEGKAYLTIALGCTGGRHRSVAVANAIFEYIRAKGKAVGINHRDRAQS